MEIERFRYVATRVLDQWMITISAFGYDAEGGEHVMWSERYVTAVPEGKSPGVTARNLLLHAVREARRKDRR